MFWYTLYIYTAYGFFKESLHHCIGKHLGTPWLPPSTCQCLALQFYFGFHHRFFHAFCAVNSIRSTFNSTFRRPKETPPQYRWPAPKTAEMDFQTPKRPGRLNVCSFLELVVWTFLWFQKPVAQQHSVNLPDLSSCNSTILTMAIALKPQFGLKIRHPTRSALWQELMCLWERKQLTWPSNHGEVPILPVPLPLRTVSFSAWIACGFTGLRSHGSFTTQHPKPAEPLESLESFQVMLLSLVAYKKTQATWPPDHLNVVPHVSSKDHSAIHGQVWPGGHVAVWPFQLHKVQRLQCRRNHSLLTCG